MVVLRMECKTEDVGQKGRCGTKKGGVLQVISLARLASMHSRRSMRDEVLTYQW